LLRDKEFGMNINFDVGLYIEWLKCKWDRTNVYTSWISYGWLWAMEINKYYCWVHFENLDVFTLDQRKQIVLEKFLSHIKVCDYLFNHVLLT
jgi:hypothetical protein